MTPETDDWRDVVRQVIALPVRYLTDLTRDGSTATVLGNPEGSLQLYALPVRPTADLRLLSHGTERVVGAKVSHDGRDVVFIRDFGGKEEYQLFRVPLAGGTERRVADLPSVRIFDVAWSRDDEEVAFSGATGAFNGVWLVDVASGGFRDVFRNRHWAVGPAFAPDDATLCFSARTTEAPTAAELVFLDREATGEPRIWMPAEGSENTGPVWHPREPTVLFKTDAQGRYDLAVVEPETSRLTYLQAGALGLGHDFYAFDWTPDGDRVFYVASKEGRSRLFVEPLDGSEPPVEMPLPTAYHGLVRMDGGGRFFVFAWSALDRPPAIGRHVLESKETTTLSATTSPVPLARAEPVTYPSFDGLPIHGWFLRPAGPAERPPCVLWIHGGPAWEVADEWNPAIQAFTTAGFAVFAPNIRGSTGYGAAFERMNVRDLGGGDLADVVAAATALRARSDVDPERIALVGASYGGYMTFLAMTKRPEPWAAGVAIVGIVDWEANYELSDAAFRSFIERYFGTPEANRDLYRDRSPIHFVEGLRAPLLIWHRGNDTRCPLPPVQRFAERAEALGKPVELEVVWDEGHGWQKTENLVRQYEAAIAFLRRSLGLEEGSDGGKG